jgi:hypothetical protein
LGSNVVISWSAPASNGLALTSYIVQVEQQADGIFSELSACDGSDPAIAASQQCTVPLDTLRASPFVLKLGDIVRAKVLAKNSYGSSDFSLVGGTATVVLVPDAPLGLQDDTAVTNSVQVGLKWQDGVANGGTSVIDYQVWYDLGTGAPYQVLASNILTRSYTATGLTAGTTYNFVVQSRNSVGLSSYSLATPVLAAQVPD